MKLIFAGSLGGLGECYTRFCEAPTDGGKLSLSLSNETSFEM